MPTPTRPNQPHLREVPFAIGDRVLISNPTGGVGCFRFGEEGFITAVHEHHVPEDKRWKKPSAHQRFYSVGFDTDVFAEKNGKRINYGKVPLFVEEHEIEPAD